MYDYYWCTSFDIYVNELTEYYGEQYGEKFREMICDIISPPISKGIREFIFDRFIEYTCNIIRDQIQNYEDDIFDYVENIVNNFYREIIVTAIDKIAESNRKYVIVDFFMTDITSKSLFHKLFRKNIRLSEKCVSCKIFIIHKDTEIPPRTYFWIFKTNITIITSMENLYDIHHCIRKHYWNNKCLNFMFGLERRKNIYCIRRD